jgi:hypothetical protein
MGIGREDFVIASSKSVDKELQIGEWPVYKRYEFKGAGEKAYVYAPRWWAEEPEDPEWLEAYRQYKSSLDIENQPNPEGAAYLAAYSFGMERHNQEERYRPLDYPDIFLQFARLVEEGPITEEVVLGWAEQYGVLGVHKIRGGIGFGNRRGGPAETVAKFGECAQEANNVLRLYEAASAPEAPHVEYLRERIVDSTNSPERLSELARDYVRQQVHGWVAGECYPHLFRHKDGAFKQGWGFKSLLGAMWLQMMWLMTTTEEDIRRCYWCRRLIDFQHVEQPIEDPGLDPGLTKNARVKYKPRKDKKFCDGRCRAKWNYHNGKGKSSKHVRKIEREQHKVKQ